MLLTLYFNNCLIKIRAKYLYSSIYLQILANLKSFLNEKEFSENSVNNFSKPLFLWKSLAICPDWWVRTVIEMIKNFSRNIYPFAFAKSGLLPYDVFGVTLFSVSLSTRSLKNAYTSNGIPLRYVQPIWQKFLLMHSFYWVTTSRQKLHSQPNYKGAIAVN